jgi:hypothetical protein
VTTALTFPDTWLTEIEDAIANPERFRWAGWDDNLANSNNWGINDYKENRATLVPAFLRLQYETFHSRAISHSITKGEHEAAALMNFYVVLKYKLWRAEFDTRYEYLREVTSGPFSVSQSTIEHFCADADKLIQENIPIRQIVTSYGAAKKATARIAQMDEAVVPEGGKLRLLENVAELGPAEANYHLDDIERKDTVKAGTALYDSQTKTLKLEIVVTHPMPLGYKGDWQDRFRERFYHYISDVSLSVAMFYMERLHVRLDMRTFK